jgi:cation:H+ antiporter
VAVGATLMFIGGTAGGIGQLVVGVVLLVAGGDKLVDGSVTIARRLGVSTLVIGLTLVAFGTSAPELAFNVIAAMNGKTDLSFGNVVGSNIANIGLVLGLCAVVFSPLIVHGQVVKRELPFLVLVSAGMIGLAVWQAGFNRIDGIILLSAFALFSYLWYRIGRRDPGDLMVVGMETEAANGLPIPIAGLFCALGIVALAGGGHLAEGGAVAIADWLDLSERYVGLTVVAVATSLPEVFASLSACRKGHNDLAVGNVVGSNMFNILLVLGTTATVHDVPLPAGGAMDLSVMMGFTLVLLAFTLIRSKTMSRAKGFVLLVAWLAYVILAR